MKRALVIGGTGPTGPHILQGLIDRGYETTIFHRGAHEPPGLPDVEHIHGDPHFQETIDEALKGREFDLVIATYGRIHLLADTFAKQCERFLAIGGMPVYAGLLDPASRHPFGLKVGTAESDPLVSEPGASKASRFAHKIYTTERHVLDLGLAGAFNASYFRYPAIYGPRQPNPMDWSVIKRVLDGRRQIILPESGMMIASRCAARNAAQHLLLAVDQPEASKNQVYNCVDEDQFSLRQWVELVSSFAGRKLDIVSMPKELSEPAEPLTRLMDVSTHCLLDGSKAIRELGYRDAIPALQAIEETTAWYLQHPITEEAYPHYPDPDPFNYAGEDTLIDAYQRGIAAIKAQAPFAKPVYSHSYAHPKQPGKGTDHRGR
ncbi:MAG: NAD-dependent epimerase/dehydratase family protein [Gammaproteobacteria bacterium]|nr:NAD-dependent epimerase/dehydratase family protein [Gammaproteobacteria bacterium]MBQ0839422.1 NAD-dependent epimerase/dehydratase family protein [Gammaproteobacteria bacterium]